MKKKRVVSISDRKPVEAQPVQLSLPLDGCRKCGQAAKEYRDGYCPKCSAEILRNIMAQMGR